MSEHGGGIAGVCCLLFGTGIDSHLKSNRPLSLIGHSSPVRISLCQQQTIERRGMCIEYIYINIYIDKYTRKFSASTLLNILNLINKHDPHAFLLPSNRLSSWLLWLSLIWEDMKRTRLIRY